MNSNVALIVGVTGIVGNTLAERLSQAGWRIYGVACRGKPSWFDNSAVDYIQCDLLNREEAAIKLRRLNQVTHIFWLTWTKQDSEAENCEANGRMFNNCLDTLIPVAKNLQHICLQTGLKHYVGPYSHFGKISHHQAPYHELLPRVSLPNFYYTLEDILHQVCETARLTWSVHRPNVIFGFSARNLANVLGSIVVYATICKYQRLSFRFPGNSRAWERVTNISDADIVAEQEVWASTNPNGKNMAFNIVNGDAVSWENLWKRLGEELNLTVPAYEGIPFSLGEWMKDKGPIWDDIVRKNSTVQTKLEEVANCWAVDLCLNFPFDVTSSMKKSRAQGFMSQRDTFGSMIHWVGEMKRKNIIPSEFKFWST